MRLFLPVVISFLFGVFVQPAHASSSLAQQLPKLSLAQKIAQLIVVPFSGQFMNENSPNFRELKTAVEELGVGGVILYGGTPYATRSLTDKLQGMATIPLLVAADFENGVTHELRNLDPSVPAGSDFPSNMAVGATRNRQFAYFQGKTTAIEARSLGVNWILAPVVDINNNPKNPIINIRSYGEDPKLVATLGASFIAGVQSQGVLATAKHFPGHGNTDMDSHLGLPWIPGNIADLESTELLPFREAIKANVGSIMTAHIVVPAYDKTRPATLSKVHLTDVLRSKMKFPGLIVTDALAMDSLSEKVGIQDPALESLLAGADILLTPSDPQDTISRIKQAVKARRLPEARIDESLHRIFEAKEKVGAFKNNVPSSRGMEQSLAHPATLKKIEEYTCTALSLIRNQKSHLPFSPARIRRLLLLVLPRTKLARGTQNKLGDALAAGLEKNVNEVLLVRVPPSPSMSMQEDIFTRAKHVDAVVISTFFDVQFGKGKEQLSPPRKRLIKKLQRLKMPSAFVAFGDPYIIQDVPFLSTYVATFSVSGPVESCVARALMGEIDFQGGLRYHCLASSPSGNDNTAAELAMSALLVGFRQLF